MAWSPSGRESLEEQPSIDVVALRLRRALERFARSRRVSFVVFTKLREGDQRTGELFRAFADFDESVDELAEVLVRLAALDEDDEPLEGFVKVGQRVHRAQEVSRRLTLFPERSSSTPILVEQKSASRLGVRGVALRS